MRISDWSSDVCSSDLLVASNVRELLRPHQQGLDPGAPCRCRRRGAHGAARNDEEVGDLELLREAVRRRSDRRAGSPGRSNRSEEHTSELQSLMRISYAVFCLKKKNTNTQQQVS